MLNIPKPPTAASPAAAAAVAGAAPAPHAPAPMTLTLTKPITTHAGQQHVLKFRSPIGDDYMRLGRLPFDIRGDATDRRIVVDFAAAGRWIAALTGIDEILVGQLAQTDFLSACQMVNVIVMNEGVVDVGNSIG